MRETKYRAWYEGRMYAAGVGYDGHVLIYVEEEDCPMCIGVSYESASGIMAQCETLMQYIGLKDKNGVEIYEGDVAHHGDINILYVCEWSDCGFKWRQLGSQSLDWLWAQGRAALVHWQPVTEVIGNIHENPELLEN